MKTVQIKVITQLLLCTFYRAYKAHVKKNLAKYNSIKTSIEKSVTFLLGGVPGTSSSSSSCDMSGSVGRIHLTHLEKPKICSPPEEDNTRNIYMALLKEKEITPHETSQ